MTAVNIDDLKAALAALAPKATSPSSARAIVEAIVEEIRAAMDKGYTYPEIARLLAEQGLDLKPNTLRLYMQPKQPKKTAPGQRSGRGRKAATGEKRRTARHESAPAAGAAAAPAMTTAAAAATGPARDTNAGGSPPTIPGAVRTAF